MLCEVSASLVKSKGRISRSPLNLRILYRAKSIVEDTGEDRSYTEITKFSIIWMHSTCSGNVGLELSSLNVSEIVSLAIHASHHRHLPMLKKLEV